MSVKIIMVESENELYYKYPGQCNPQDCYIELDCAEETLSASYNTEIGNAVPGDVWRGHLLRWKIPPLKDGAANMLMEELAPVAERIVAGYESVWDGNNYVADFTACARKAIEEAERICQNEKHSYDIEDVCEEPEEPEETEETEETEEE